MNFPKMAYVSLNCLLTPTRLTHLIFKHRNLLLSQNTPSDNKAASWLRFCRLVQATAVTFAPPTYRVMDGCHFHSVLPIWEAFMAPTSGLRLPALSKAFVACIGLCLKLLPRLQRQLVCARFAQTHKLSTRPI